MPDYPPAKALASGWVDSIHLLFRLSFTTNKPDDLSFGGWWEATSLQFLEWAGSMDENQRLFLCWTELPGL
jgi:hypothetical protein